jgi:hypothetical protein
VLKSTDELIEATIDGISGFISANFSEKYGLPIEKSLEMFLASKTYLALSDKKNGYYWDSIPQIQEMFSEEMNVEYRSNGVFCGGG